MQLQLRLLVGGGLSDLEWTDVTLSAVTEAVIERDDVTTFLELQKVRKAVSVREAFMRGSVNILTRLSPPREKLVRVVNDLCSRVPLTLKMLPSFRWAVQQQGLVQEDITDEAFRRVMLYDDLVILTDLHSLLHFSRERGRSLPGDHCRWKLFSPEQCRWLQSHFFGTE